MRKPEKKGTKVQIMTAREAVELIDDGDTLAVCGAGGGIVDPSSLIESLKDRYVETKEPKNLTLWHSSGLGDRGDRGMSPLAQKGMVKRAIGGHWGSHRVWLRWQREMRSKPIIFRRESWRSWSEAQPPAIPVFYLMWGLEPLWILETKAVN